LALGMIMTTDTLKTASTVVLNVGHWHFYALWALGGLLSLVGAMCYVELASAFPDAGGDYAFLRRAYGGTVGALFAWSRFSIMHTGWMALMAFMLADYAGAIVPLGRLGEASLALGAVAALAGLNLLNVRRGFSAQAALIGLVTLGFLSVVAAAAKLALQGALPPQVAAPPAAPSLAKISVALIYIFLAYGGWSDAATLSAEVRGAGPNGGRGMFVAMIGSLLVLMAIYLALNAAMVLGLGESGVAGSAAPAADLLGRAFGPFGRALIVGVVGVSAIASINSTMIVGARTTYAAARDIPALAALGRWDGSRGVPARAVLAEAAATGVLIVLGSFAKSGFNAMVDYMTPVYWLFMCLSIGAVMILRRRHPEAPRPVRTPFYPLFPALFLLISVTMFASSLADLGAGALYGAAVMAAGLVLVLLVRVRSPATVGALG
jgi:amino acid transporter